MIKGLGLLGASCCNNVVTTREIAQPKVLILGGGTMGYILAVLLSVVYGLEEKRIVVTGRDPSKLTKFLGIATRQPVQAFISEEGRYIKNSLTVTR